MRRRLPDGVDWSELKQMRVRLETLEPGDAFVQVSPPRPPESVWHKVGGKYIAGEVARVFDGSVIVEIGKPSTRTIEQRDGTVKEIRMTNTDRVPWARTTLVVPREDFDWLLEHAD